jgi:hypothetical protein
LTNGAQRKRYWSGTGAVAIDGDMPRWGSSYIFEKEYDNKSKVVKTFPNSHFSHFVPKEPVLGSLDKKGGRRCHLLPSKI